MRRFFRPMLAFARYSSDVAAAPRPKIIFKFNPGNQNHLSKALANASLNSRIDKNTEFDKEAFLKNYPHAVPVLNICVSYGLLENHIMEAIEKFPEILQFDYSNISSVVYQFQTLGFRERAISAIIAQYPHILQYKPKDISDTVDIYRKNHFGERFITKLLVTYPLLLSLNNEDLDDRLKRINYLFENKINRSTNLLLRNPAIVCCPWDDVEKKFDYLYKQMRILPKDMSRSQALSKPLSFIMLRHTFLDRCGVFIRHGMKDDEGFNPHVNPTLSEIVDTDDYIFAKEIAKVSPEEYEVFKTLMKYEEELEDDEADSDLNMSSDFDLRS